MLKLNYSDFGLFLEQVAVSLDTVMAQRAMLAVSVGETFYLEPGRASFLLPAALPEIHQLVSVLKASTSDAIALDNVDDGYMEVSLKGTWMAESPNAESGTFMAALAPESEQLIFRLWQVTQPQMAYYL